MAKKKTSIPPPKTRPIKKGPFRGGKPPVEYRFKKGEVANPKGRPRNVIPQALKELTVDSYREVIKCVCSGNLESLKEMIEDPTISVLQVTIAQAVLNALRSGDYAVIERIAERIVGKIPEELNLNSKNQNMNLNANMSVDEAKLALAFDRMREKL